jgi:hypothetical protein
MAKFYYYTDEYKVTHTLNIDFIRYVRAECDYSVSVWFQCDDHIIIRKPFKEVMTEIEAILGAP